MNSRYSRDRILNGLVYFVLGKGLSAIAGFGAVLLVIRVLSVEEFAAYSILIALVEMISAISGFGFVHAVLRYVPELYAKHYQTSLKNFVASTFVMRTALLVLVTMLAYFFSNIFANVFSLERFLFAYQVFLIVVVLRATTHFLSQVLESTLHQKTVQIGFLTATVARFVGMLYLTFESNPNLVDVIWVEAISDVLSLVIMFASVVRLLMDSSNQNPIDDGKWLKGNLKQIAKFAFAGYVQHMAITPYAGHTNRLVGGSMLTVASMAAYGFALSMYEYIRRYMPALLLVGLIRPVIVARYSQHKNFSAAASLCNQVVQVNILLILGVVNVLLVGGGDMLMVISAGKYGQGSVLLLAMLFFVLLLETQRDQLEMLAQTIERYHFLIYSNIVLALSIFLAILLIPAIGALGFPIANGIGLLVANEWVRKKMKDGGFIFKHPWGQTMRTLLICLVTTNIGVFLKFIGLAWYFAMALSIISYMLLAYILCKNSVLDFIRSLMGNNSNESVASK